MPHPNESPSPEYLARLARFMAPATKPGKPGHPKLAQLRREKKWQVCEAIINSTGQTCRRQIKDGISTLCPRHLRYRGQYGSVRVSRHIDAKDYYPFLKIIRKRFRKTPPPTPILEAITSLLTPPQQFRTGQPGWKARALLVRELARIADPRARKKETKQGIPADYRPVNILAVITACQAFLEERQNFPGDSESIALAYSVLRLWRRPRGWTKTKKMLKSQAISATVLRGFAKRIRERTQLMVFVLQTSRAILADQAALQAAKVKAAQAARQKAIKDAAARKLLPPPPAPHPGNRPMLLTSTDAEKLREWKSRAEKWNRETPAPEQKVFIPQGI